MKSRSTFHECSKCHDNICRECVPLCNKCHNHICLNCYIPCYHCHTNYCICQLNTSTKCNNKFCECTALINCTACNQSSCPTHINACQICTQKYCSCTPLVGCVQCKGSICNGCGINIKGIGSVCGRCLQRADNKLELRAISATTSTDAPYCELGNLLEGGNKSSLSKNYGSGAHPFASDHIILEFKAGSIAITKLIIPPNTSHAFNKMEIYVGEEGNCTLSHTRGEEGNCTLSHTLGEEGNWTLSHTITQCRDKMIITLPHPLSAKFIKLKFIGVKYCYFDIYQVQVFGKQLLQ